MGTKWIAESGKKFLFIFIPCILLMSLFVLEGCGGSPPGEIDFSDIMGTNEYHNLPSCPVYFYNPINNQGYANDRLNRLHDILKQIRDAGWGSLYELNVFDCTNMAGFIHDYLEEQDFDVYILVAEITQRYWLDAVGIEIEKLLGLSEGGKEYHAWLAVRIFDDGRYIAVESTTPIETWYPAAYRYQAAYADSPGTAEYEYEGLPQVAAVMKQLSGDNN